MQKSVIEIQTRLKDLGLYTGKLDGITGKLTRAAIAGFQRLNGQRATGVVSQLILLALFPDPMPARDDMSGEDAVPPDIPMVWPHQRDCMTFYGQVGQHQTMLELPYAMKLAWDLRKPIRQFSVHEKVKDSAQRCFERVGKTYSETERKKLGLDLFGGCLNVRKMTGGSSWSMHAWGIAIDFDPTRNGFRMGKEARLMQPDAVPFWEIWESEGWVSLGRARGFDPMHVQAARL